MELLDQGYGTQGREWVVREPKSPGFSRVYLIESGEVTYSDATQCKKLDPGKLYIFPSYAPFSITHHPDRPICCLWFHLNLFPTLVDRLIEISPSQHKDLYHLLLAVQNEVTCKGISKEYLYSMAQSFVCFCHKNGYLSPPDHALAPILSYIQQNYTQNITVESISQNFGYTPEYFIRLFKKKVHISPYQYIINCRLNKAIILLKENMAVSQAAQQCGYSDVKSFSRAFKRHFGKPPALYTKTYHPTA